jgi:hypothetical protein
MSRRFAALTILAIAGALVIPEPSSAAFGGARAGGMRAGGFRAQITPRPPARLFPAVRGTSMPRFASPVSRPVFQTSRVHIRPVATSSSNYRIRLSHRAYFGGWAFPFTTGEDASYIGTPYDPAETIPVYAPYPPEERAAPLARPRVTNAADDNANQDACRSEKVTVPASEGEREITVVRC